MGTWGFSYDTLNRLITGTPSSGSYAGQHACWSYDPFGNRTAQSLQTAACPTPETSVTATATYNSNNQVNWTTVNAAVNGFSYDAAGNLLSDGVNGYVYDDENRIVSATLGSGGTAAYSYDAEGQRVRKAVGATVDEYVYDNAGHQVGDMQPNGAMKRMELYAGGRHLATYDIASNATYFIHGDWLGSERLRTTSAGAAYESCSNLPFGDGQQCAGGADISPLHFTGKPRDAETTLDYFGARYYASSMGRFMSPDLLTVTFARQVDPQQLNLYAYVRNNPLKLVDPTGMYIDDSKLSEKDMAKWAQVCALAAQTDSNGDLLHPNLANELVSLDQDTRVYTIQGGAGLDRDVAGLFTITQLTPDGKDFTAATIQLDFNKIMNGKGVTPAGFNLNYDKFGGLNDNARRFAELAGHELGHGIYATQNPADAANTQQLMNERQQILNGPHKYPLPPDMQQKMEAPEAGLARTEKFAQQQEKIINGELRASQANK